MFPPAPCVTQPETIRAARLRMENARRRMVSAPGHEAVGAIEEFVAAVRAYARAVLDTTA